MGAQYAVANFAASSASPSTVARGASSSYSPLADASSESKS